MAVTFKNINGVQITHTVTEQASEDAREALELAAEPQRLQDIAKSKRANRYRFESDPLMMEGIRKRLQNDIPGANAADAAALVAINTIQVEVLIPPAV